MSEEIPGNHHYSRLLLPNRKQWPEMPWYRKPGRIVAMPAAFLPDDTEDVATIIGTQRIYSQNANNPASKD
ncbi:MAG: hypothetical protein L3J36_01325 [Rhodobacteraceae bacterium]|nr:hypothetical protein [Paracoccaceae bacterium]